MKRFVLRLCCSSLLAGSVLAGPVMTGSAAQLYDQQVAAPHVGDCLQLSVDLEASPGFAIEQGPDGSVLRYRMAFNNVTEGWSWQPGVDAEREDYYRFKFLPVQSRNEPRGQYEGEDKIGSRQAMSVQWRYDYFLAFDNLYAFYPRVVDDDAGFTLALPKDWKGHAGLLASLCLSEPVTHESTTFWKATHAQPVDFTLKKRYLIGHLDKLEVVDLDNQRRLGSFLPRAAP